MKTSHKRGESASRKRDGWVRLLALAVTAMVLVLELYVWFSWKVSRDVLDAFQEAVTDTSSTAP